MYDYVTYVVWYIISMVHNKTGAIQYDVCRIRLFNIEKLDFHPKGDCLRPLDMTYWIWASSMKTKPIQFTFWE